MGIPKENRYVPFSSTVPLFDPAKPVHRHYNDLDAQMRADSGALFSSKSRGAAMRKLLVALVLTGLLAVAGNADDAKPAKVDKKDAAKKQKAPVSLKVGDPAPMLKASKWLQGEEVKAFEPGKIYIVEFWATWCGPCIVMMPHMAEMQAAFKDKGVTFIGFTAKDPNNTEEKVVAMVKKRGPKLKYTFAYADDRDTYDAWMKAAGRNGIPCSFVVDAAGKIAYIGHPMYLDVVLPKVVDGTWKGEKSKEELDKVEKEVNGVFRALGGKDPEASLKAIDEFETRNPALAKIPYFVGPKMNLLLQAGKTDEVHKMAEEVMTRATKQDDTMMLRTVSASLRSPAAKGDKDLLKLSLKAANAMLQAAGDHDAGALINLAETYFATGDKEKAREYGKKAVDAADSPGMKRYIEQRVKTFEE
jgi:thiol-disulfide isomerase/thioredoxin